MTASPAPARHIPLLMALCALCALTTSGCSLLVSFEECSSDADCKSKIGPDATCSDGVCQGTPVTLEGATCTIPAKSKAREADAILIGVLMPLSGGEEGYGEPIVRAVDLAIEEFNGAGGVRGRQLGLIVCDTQGKDDVALAAARHLAATAKVSAIVGPDYSSQTIAIANDTTIKNNVLLITPSGTSQAISDLVDKDLVWRTIISDAIQGEALAKTVSDLIATRTPNPNTAKITLLLPEDDAYSSGLAEILLAGLPARYNTSNKDLISIINYPNASAGMSDIYASTIAAVGAEAVQPDVVVLLGTSEAWEIIKGLELTLDDKPFYVMPDGTKNQDASKQAFPSPSPDLRARVLGTVPQTPSSSYEPYRSFSIRFQLAYGELPNSYSSVAQAYDAAYLIGLGIAAGGATGPDIARGIRKLSDPAAAEFVANTNKLPATLNSLVQGQTLNYEGASGPLDFNAKGDPSTGAVALWCLAADASLPEQPQALLDESGAFTPRSCGQIVEPPEDMGMEQPDMELDMAPDMVDEPDMSPDMGA